MIRLELPNIKFKQTYLDAVKEFIDNGSDNGSTNHYFKRSLEQFDSEFETFVQEKINNENCCSESISDLNAKKSKIFACWKITIFKQDRVLFMPFWYDSINNRFAILENIRSR